MTAEQIASALEAVQQTAALAQAAAAPLLALPEFAGTAAALRLAPGLLGLAAAAFRQGGDPEPATWAALDSAEVAILADDARAQIEAEQRQQRTAAGG